MQAFLLVGIGGALGAMGRYGITVALGALSGSFPAATFLVNMAGSIAMGLLVGLLAKLLPPYHDEIQLLVGVGILGGFTTFSSFSLDAVGLIARGSHVLAAAYVAGSVLLSIAGLAFGLWIVRVLA